MAEEPPVMFTMDSALKIQRAVNTVSQWAGQTETPRNRNQGGYGAPVTLRVRNDSGDDRKRGEVLCIDEVVGTFIENLPEQHRQIFASAVAPDTTNRRHIPCILLEDVATNGYADVALYGVCVATVDIQDEDHNFAEMVDDEFVLRSAGIGPVRIISIGETGTGEKRALVALGVGGGDLIVCKTDSEVAIGDTVTVSVYAGALGSETDTGENIEDVLCRFGSVLSGAWALAAWTGVGYELLAAECSGGGGSSDGADLDDGSVPLAKLEDIAAGSILASLTGGPVDLLPLSVSGAAALNASGATGTGNLAYSNSPSFTTPALGAATVTSINGTAPGAGGLTVFAASGSTGSGNAVLATSPTFVTPVLGAATATSINGTSIPTSVTLAKTADKLSAFAATSSAELRTVVSDETGTGGLVFADTPTLITPVLGVATATSINGTTIPSSTTLLDASSIDTSAKLAAILGDESGSSGGFVRAVGAAISALTGLAIRSTGAAFDLTIASSEAISAGRTLSLNVGNANRSLTISADATISGTNTGDQTTITGNAGSATVLATARAIYGNTFDGSAAITSPVGPTFGGTGQSSWTLGETLYCSASNTLSKLAGNTTTTKQYLSQTGNGSVSAAPAWATIAQADISGLKTTDAPTFAGITCTASNSGVQRHTFRNTNSGSGAYCAIDFGNDIGSSDAEFLLNSSNNTTYAGARGFSIICSGDIIHHQGGAERCRWKAGGDFLIGTSTSPTGTSGKTLMFGANGGNPVPGTGIAGLFAKTVTQTEMFAVDSAGNITQISKHYDPDLAEAAGIVLDPDDDYPQIDCEENPFLGLRALTYRGQRVLIDLPPEECWDWESIQDQQQATHEKRAQDWADTVRAHAEVTAKRDLARSKWERLEPIAKVFVPAPEAPRELDMSQDPGKFERQECPAWISRIIERRKGQDATATVKA